MSETLEQWAARKRRDFDSIDGKSMQATETEKLAEVISARAPVDSGRLRASFRARANQVLSTAPYARKVDEGGLIKPTKGAFLTVPVQAGYNPRSPGYFTVKDPFGKSFVLSGRGDLAALRLRAVQLRARPYLTNSSEAWAESAEKRTADAFEGAR